VRHFGGRGAHFFKLQKISNLKFQKNTEKIPEYSQRISIPVYKFSSRNTMYSTLGKNNKITDWSHEQYPFQNLSDFVQFVFFAEPKLQGISHSNFARS
jgi:hypothetical protein